MLEVNIWGVGKFFCVFFIVIKREVFFFFLSFSLISFEKILGLHY